MDFRQSIFDLIGDEPFIVIDRLILRCSDMRIERVDDTEMLFAEDCEGVMFPIRKREARHVFQGPEIESITSFTADDLTIIEDTESEDRGLFIGSITDKRFEKRLSKAEDEINFSTMTIRQEVTRFTKYELVSPRFFINALTEDGEEMEFRVSSLGTNTRINIVQ